METVGEREREREREKEREISLESENDREKIATSYITINASIKMYLKYINQCSW